MPHCPKCVVKLTKRKRSMSYHCKRHGFVRKINTPHEGCKMTDNEFEDLINSGTIKFNKSTPARPKPKRTLNLKGVLL